jgi:predicted dehydrogenase
MRRTVRLGLVGVGRWAACTPRTSSAVGAALSDQGYAELGDIHHLVVTLRFANGALGVIDNSRSAGYGYSARPRWWARKRGSASTATRRVYNQWLTPRQASVDRLDDFRELFPEAYLLELEDFAAAIRDDHPPSVTGEDGLAAFVLAPACDRSRREGRTIRVRDEEPETEVGP